MKNKLYVYIICFATLFSSCDNFLDIPEDINIGVQSDDVFNSYNNTLGFLNTCYNNLEDIHFWDYQGLGRTSINCASDEAVAMYAPNGGSTLIGVINSGDWFNKSNSPEIGWADGSTGSSRRILPVSFQSLGVANFLINKSNLLKNMTKDQRNELLGQAYFFRAWYYFQIIQRYGGMPKMDKIYNGNSEFNEPRLTYHQSSEWMVQDLDSAIALLPYKYDDSDKGRVTKIAAMAVKSMAQLYDASPLMQNDLSSTEVKPYDIERCKIAAKSASEVLDAINEKRNPDIRFMKKEEYKNIFYTKDLSTFVTDESIWYYNHASLNRAGSASRTVRGVRSLYVPVYYSGGTGNDAASFNAPTQNIVDMFEAINPVTKIAYPIDNPHSGYNPQKPFENRDERLANNIIVPGQQWGKENSTDLFMEMYVGGRDYNLVFSNPNTSNRTPSGYACSKFWWPELFNQIPTTYAHNLNTVYIRVAQVYLDLAEAMNEAYGPNGKATGISLSAVEALNIVRNRVGLSNVASEYTTSKELLRDRIRNERAVELMYENHRFKDIRRWMIAHTVFNSSTPIKGMKATRKNPTEPDKRKLEFTYETFTMTDQVRVFGFRNYWYPLDPTVSARYPKIVQNPGW